MSDEILQDFGMKMSFFKAFPKLLSIRVYAITSVITIRYSIVVLYCTLLNYVQQVLYLRPMIPPKRFDISPPLTGEYSEGLCIGAFLFFFKPNEGAPTWRLV